MLLRSKLDISPRSSLPKPSPLTCSTDYSDQERPSPQERPRHKRIGRYSFRLEDCIGSGFSSRVYKGVRDDTPGWFAIKAVRLQDMAMANAYLLTTEVDILQALDHPNVIKLEEVIYSHKHCYLITEYCEGGTLERYARKRENVEWGSIVHQIAQGCQYLAGMNIVHRDLKPANIFLKEGRWKIGDFGFAKRLPSAEALIVEGFRVGSPLFMPLETLQRNMYSAKSDSFALGVIIYHLILREFPWEGASLGKLTRNHRQKQLDWTRFQLLPKQITTLLQGLLNTDMRQRASLCSCDFSIFQGQRSLGEMEKGLLELGGRVREQVVLCQFIHYLIGNSMRLLEDGDRLYSLMSDHLHHLTRLFAWDRNPSLAQIKQHYILPLGNPTITADHYRRILLSLKEIIVRLREGGASGQEVALEKLLEYYCICRLIVEAKGEQLWRFLDGIVLHKDYKDLLPNQGRIDALMQSLSNQ